MFVAHIEGHRNKRVKFGYHFIFGLGGNFLYFSKWSTTYLILPCHYVSWRVNNQRLTSSPVFGSLSLSDREWELETWRDGLRMGLSRQTLMWVLKIFRWVYFFGGCSVEFVMVWGHRAWDYIYMCTFEMGLNYGLQWQAVQYNLWVRLGWST